MNFWAHQETARRNTFWLFLLYAVLLLGFSLLAAFVINYAFDWYFAYNKPVMASGSFVLENFTLHSVIRFAGITAVIPLLVGIMTLFAPASLSAGGRGVAESLSGTLLPPQSKDSGERRLLNVVEEMAIASGMPVPPVYVLQEEKGINAFAAGATVNDAVIGVTRGAVDYLDRSELQAVIAHEFSHILNGDMRLNIRFAQLAFGLMCLSEVSRVFLRGFGRGSSRNDKDSKGKALIMIIALVCYISGLLMAFLGHILQAAVNRQREFLADASSVQFTRTNALASALKKIGGLSYGSKLSEASLAGHYNHFFFSEASWSLFSTHPPLEKRILRLDPSWNGVYPSPNPVVEDKPAAMQEWKGWAGTPPAAGTGTLASSGLAPAYADSLHEKAARSGGAAASANGGVSPLAAVFSGSGHLAPTLPHLWPLTEKEALEKLRAACREPLDACYVIFALLLGDTQEIQAKQLAIITDTRRHAAVREYKHAAACISAEAYLPLIESAIPALKALSYKQYAVFYSSIQRLIHADGEFSFREWVLAQLIRSQVGAQYAPVPKSQPAQSLVCEAGLPLLAALAHLQPDAEEAAAAFAAGVRGMGLPARALTEKPDEETLSQSMDTLRHSSEPLRSNFMSAAMAVAAHDGKLSREEAMFMRLLSLCLGRPVSQERYEALVNKYS